MPATSKLSGAAPSSSDSGGNEASVPTEFGLSQNLVELLETPDDVMKRVLMPDEKVLSTFDCYFPTQFIPQWKIILLLFATFGLYIFVLAYRAIAQWCYKMKCCTPALVSFEKGKLAVTNKGRIICWREVVNQVKQTSSICSFDFWCSFFKCCCPNLAGAPVNYHSSMETAVFDASKIRQVSKNFQSSALCIWCCVSYDCTVEISFEQFTPTSDDFVNVRGKHDYYFMIQNILNTGVSAVESMVGIHNEFHVLYICSGTEDRVHNGDIHEVVNDMGKLYAEVIQALPPVAYPDVFLNSVSDAERAVPELTDKLAGVTFVTLSGEVKIPKTWLTLLPGEEIITGIGETFQMRLSEWFWALVTCGLEYCCVYLKLKKVRHAVVLTTKRVLVLDIHHGGGMLPENLKKVNCSVRSFFPGNVISGYYTCNQINKDECWLRMACIMPPMKFRTGIVSSAGELTFKFGRSEMKALPFAKALQCTVARRATCLEYKSPNGPSRVANLGEKHLAMLPLLSGEHLLDRIDGHPMPVPFCGPDSYIGAKCLGCLRFCNCMAQDAEYLCSKPNCGRNIFPTIPRLLTCGFYPLNIHKDMFVTEHSIITYVRTNRSCLVGNMCESNNNFGVTWVSNRMFIGHTTEIDITGSEHFCSRLCRGSMVGRMCCPIGDSSYDTKVQFEKGVFFQVGFTDVNANWLKDNAVLSNLQVLTQLQNSVTARDLSGTARRSEALEGDTPMATPLISKVQARAQMEMEKRV